jgi:hypothetical protein
MNWIPAKFALITARRPILMGKILTNVCKYRPRVRVEITAKTTNSVR